MLCDSSLAQDLAVLVSVKGFQYDLERKKKNQCKRQKTFKLKSKICFFLFLFFLGSATNHELFITLYFILMRRLTYEKESI